jgi:uncharacterized delta-60 repeat protein
MSSAIPRAPLLSLLFTFGLLTPGCQIIIGIEDLREGPDGGSGSTDARGDDATPAPDAPSEPGFYFEVRTIDPTIPLDGKNVIEVEIRRHGGFAGEVTVTAPTPPVGIVVTDLVVAVGQSTAQVEVGAIGPLQIGDTVSFDLVATGTDDLVASAAVNDAEVTGKPGAFDTTFGAQQTGYATVSLGSDDSGSFRDVEVLPNGSFLALGSSTGGLGAGFMILARFTAEGLFDPTFNGGALVRDNFQTGSSGESCEGRAVGRQVDGSILGIGGHRAGTSFPPDIALIQRTASGGAGSPSYGSHGGKSRVDLAGTDEEVTDGLVLPDSKVLAVGRSNNRLFVARISAQGSLDTTFATGGFHVLDVAPLSGAAAVVTDASDRIVVAGFVENNTRDVVVVRYTKNGELDTTFGQSGVVVLGNTEGSERGVAVAVRPDGRIVVAGDATFEGISQVHVYQFLENGDPDPSFGVQGVSAVPNQGSDATEDMAVLPDGRILVAGNSTPGGPGLVRLTRDGAIDPYFGHEGLFPLYLGDSGVVRGLEVLSNAKVLISGGNQGGTPGPGTFGVVVRMWM